ncbi:PBP1A family penicillin-binding protein [Lactobacillus sp. Sy-1]|uniref:PBP1A family penicillin-binding protein n=1 Tax=Lactobacillus sp. Sy-1 TaxID=2109645 RepID=UPI001C59B546|nr:PBP1A family penicillin-binding protein [Lactobacillus sp. Sy-1]MBW1605594.1 penicillin-binding protein [Lactobacillus sp. Sy-1]
MSDNNQGSRVNRNHSKYRGGKRHLIRKIILGVLAFFVVVFALGTGLFFYYASSAPQITYNALSSDNSTKIYDSSGKVISRLGIQNREYVKSKNIPTQLKEAVVSIEDRRFYKEGGVDPLRIIGAAFGNLTDSSLGLQGGSTLTQQLVKLSVFSTAATDRTLKRKAQEAYLAIKVNQQYSKDQILEFYINKVYMGNNVYGMQTAAEYYYGKKLSKLSLPEFALLAGMPQSPTNYNPYQYPKYAKERRNQVLQAMVRNKEISQATADKAKAVSIKHGLAKTHRNTDVTSVNEKYIDAYLKQTLQELKARGYNTNSGLKVYTNLNLSNQKYLYNLANHNSSIAFPNNQFQVGATMMNSNNGKVVAMLGNRKTKVSFGLNRAVQTDRSSGSTMKPLMDYGPAIEYLHYPTYQTVQDTPFTYPGTTTKLMDFDDRYEGDISMRRALVESRNIPAIRTLQEVGIDRATEFLKGLGISQKSQYQLQNGIGAYISSEQEAAAYAAFANGGTYYKPYYINKIVEANGDVHNYSSKGTKAMSSATAFMITDMLKGVMTDSNGSGTAAKVDGLYEAGKTGTTQYPDNYLSSVPSYSSMDSWFTGYTKNFSLSIWTGYDKPLEPNHYVSEQQSQIAQQIYKYEMAYASQNKPNVDWTKPNDVGEVSRDGKTEYYVAGYSNGVMNSSSASSSSSSSIRTNSSSTSESSDKDSSNRTNNSSGRASSDIESKPSDDSTKSSSSSSSDSSSSSSSSSNQNNDNNQNDNNNNNNQTNATNDNNNNNNNN